VEAVGTGGAGAVNSTCVGTEIAVVERSLAPAPLRLYPIVDVRIV
jgi:hypothetical protein